MRGQGLKSSVVIPPPHADLGAVPEEPPTFTSRARLHRLARRSRRTKALDLGLRPVRVDRTTALTVALDVDGVGRAVSGDVNDDGIRLGFREVRYTTRFAIETSGR